MNFVKDTTSRYQDARVKAVAQFKLRKMLGVTGYGVLASCFERLTDMVFKPMR